jgi:DNA-binding CsgD family transcriptional regulator
MTSSGPPTNTIIGRAAELRALDEFLDLVATGPALLLLEGDPGIGKSTLLNEGQAAARRRAYRVLECRPIQAEAQLAYTAVGDLLADVDDAELAALPEPQRRGLEVALLRADPAGQELFPRAVALGLQGVLAGRARSQPTVVAIDDAQWLDHPSARALAFVARRLRREPIGFLLTGRPHEDLRFPSDIERDPPFAPDRLRHVPITALAAAELDLLLETQLGRPFPRRTLARLRGASGGNAFFALELGRAMLEQADRGVPQDHELPIPPSLQRLVGDRISRLPPAALEVAGVAAALSRPTIGLVDAALGGQDAATGLAAAEAAGIIDVDRETQRIVFGHPLHASIAYSRLSPEKRRELHGRLASVLDDPEERGRHLALATERPDAGVAAALDEAARRARARGAPDSAAELWEQARRLTPPEDGEQSVRRGIEATERYFEAGDAVRSRELLRTIVAAAPPGRQRALALARLGWVTSHTDGFPSGAALFRQALAEPGDDLAVRIEIEEGLAWSVHSTSGVGDAREHAHTALALAESLGDPTLLAGALSHVAFLESLGGRGLALETSRRAVAIGEAPAWSQILGRPDWIHALLLVWDDDLPAARRQFEALHRGAVEQGDEHSLPFILFHLARVELLAGDWELARAHARECDETTRQSGQVSERPYSFAIEALVEAHLGLVEPARAKIAEGLALARQTGAHPAGMEMLAVRGFLHLSLGDLTAADRTLDTLATEVERTGLRDPALFRFHGDAIEARIGLGRRDEARALLDHLDRMGAELERTWVRVIACRSRGLLSAALGDIDAAYEALERGLALEHLGQPFEHARTLLVLGTVQRRDKKKRAARAALEGALQIFRRLGAELWASRARAELSRIGGRPAASGLTATEERVAALIASGRTYKEAADELFISPKTVQWNLSKVYRKLGIRSRAELPARLAAEARPDD